MKPLSLISLFLILLLASCESVSEPQLDTRPLVVEGWIETGANPIVTVAHPFDLKEGSVNIGDYVEKWCRVSIYDGDKRYLLTGKINNDYPTSFIYTSSQLRGQRGHSYRLLVESESDTVEAVSTIMPAASISSLKAEKVEGVEGAYTLKLFLNNIDPDGMYKVFVRVDGRSKIFHGSLMGTFTGRDYDDTKGHTVSLALNASDNNDNFTHYFHAGEKVYVKIYSLDRPVYDFWKSYDNSVLMSGNLFFTFADNCPTNIDGGLGYWAAYGSSHSIINIPR